MLDFIWDLAVFETAFRTIGFSIFIAAASLCAVGALVATVISKIYSKVKPANKQLPLRNSKEDSESIIVNEDNELNTNEFI